MSETLNTVGENRHSTRHEGHNSGSEEKNNSIFGKVKKRVFKRHHFKGRHYAKNVEESKNGRFGKKYTEDEIRSMDEQISLAMIEILSMKTTFYEKISKMISTNSKFWKDIPFLAGKKKRDKCINDIESEIKSLSGESFNFEKYKPVIYAILGLTDKTKFTEAIVKNMYIAKLQNIILILQSMDYDNSLEEITENKTNGYYR